MEEAADRAAPKWSLINAGLGTLLLLLFLLFFGLLAGERLYKIYFPNTVQDTCSFGDISNERYVELLQRARVARTERWPPLSRDNPELEDQLQSQLAEFLKPIKDRHERIAAFHAFMRAYAAEFRTNRPDTATPFEDASASRVKVRYVYRLNLNDAGRYVFFYPTYYIFADADTFTLYVRGGNFKDGTTDEPRSKIGDQCPRTPSQAWMDKFYPEPEQTR